MTRTGFLLVLAKAGRISLQVDSLILPIISRESWRNVSFSIFASISTTSYRAGSAPSEKTPRLLDSNFFSVERDRSEKMQLRVRDSTHKSYWTLV